MLEKFLNLQRDYPIGTAVVIDADGMPEIVKRRGI